LRARHHDRIAFDLSRRGDELAIDARDLNADTPEALASAVENATVFGLAVRMMYSRTSAA